MTLAHKHAVPSFCSLDVHSHSKGPVESQGQYFVVKKPLQKGASVVAARIPEGISMKTSKSAASALTPTAQPTSADHSHEAKPSSTASSTSRGSLGALDGLATRTRSAGATEVREASAEPKALRYQNTPQTTYTGGQIPHRRDGDTYKVASYTNPDTKEKMQLTGVVDTSGTFEVHNHVDHTPVQGDRLKFTVQNGVNVAVPPENYGNMGGGKKYDRDGNEIRHSHSHSSHKRHTHDRSDSSASPPRRSAPAIREREEPSLSRRTTDSYVPSYSTSQSGPAPRRTDSYRPTPPALSAATLSHTTSSYQPLPSQSAPLRQSSQSVDPYQLPSLSTPPRRTDSYRPEPKSLSQTTLPYQPSPYQSAPLQQPSQSSYPYPPTSTSAQPSYLSTPASAYPTNTGALQYSTTGYGEYPRVRRDHPESSGDSSNDDADRVFRALNKTEDAFRSGLAPTKEPGKGSRTISQHVSHGSNFDSEHMSTTRSRKVAAAHAAESRANGTGNGQYAELNIEGLARLDLSGKNGKAYKARDEGVFGVSARNSALASQEVLLREPVPKSRLIDVHSAKIIPKERYESESYQDKNRYSTFMKSRTIKESEPLYIESEPMTDPYIERKSALNKPQLDPVYSDRRGDSGSTRRSDKERKRRP